MRQEPTSSVGRDPGTMLGNGYYAAHTAGARAVIDTMRPLIAEAVSRVPIPSNPAEPMVLADYGAADGANSADAVRAIIAGLRTRADSRSVRVVYSDQPDNDYSALFRWLHGPRDQQRTASYLAEFDDVFVSAVGDTFYRQVLPGDSVHIGLSATAAHWLSRSPGAADGHLHSVRATGNDLVAWQDVARIDWENFLLLRARELAPGGFLVTANLCVDDRGRYVGSTGNSDVLDTFDELWRSMGSDEWISDRERSAATFTQYYRTRAELESPFLDESGPVRRAGLRLVRGFTRIVQCPYAAEFEHHRDPDRYADAFVPALRSWSEGVFLDAVDANRPQTERRIIVDELYRRFHRRVRQQPRNYRLDYVHAYLLAERRGVN